MKNFIFFREESNIPSDVRAILPAQILSKEQLLSEIANHLSFPDYFGNNWDALYDCLTDLSWYNDKKIVLIHLEIPMLPYDDLKTYLKLLLDAMDINPIFEAAFPITEEKKLNIIINEIENEGGRQ